jgi:hypothetical protein
MKNSIKWTEAPQNSNMIAKIGASVMMLMSVLATAVFPGVFMFLFAHNIFMMLFYIYENVLVFIQRIDQKVKIFNEENLKDGKLAYDAERIIAPHAKNIVNQLVSLSKEVEEHKAEEPKAEVKAEEAKSERKYF